MKCKCSCQFHVCVVEFYDRMGCLSGLPVRCIQDHVIFVNWKEIKE